MSHPELQDEIDAIEAIYPESVHALGPGIIQLTVPDYNDISLQLAFPDNYPLTGPSLIQVTTKNVRKYPDVKYVENKISELIETVFVEEMVIIFELLGEIQIFLEAYEEKHTRELELINERLEQVKIENRKERLAQSLKENDIKTEENIQTRATKDRDYTAGWVQSDPVLDRGSSFIAFARASTSIEEAHAFIEELTCDRKIAKATHNMTSLRIKGANGTSFQDCDDDGETAAGSRMLHLMTIMDVWNVVVVVSRWFGGTHLGPDRFKHINTATRAVLIRGGFYVEHEKKKK